MRVFHATKLALRFEMHSHAPRGCLFSGRCSSIYLSSSPLFLYSDTGDTWTPQAYDISNIQGFTQSVSIGANGCQSTTCTSVNCPCSQAYPPGVSARTFSKHRFHFGSLAENVDGLPPGSQDPSGCGHDLPVRACGVGNIGFWGSFIFSLLPSAWPYGC